MKLHQSRWCWWSAAPLAIPALSTCVCETLTFKGKLELSKKIITKALIGSPYKKDNISSHSIYFPLKSLITK